MIRDYNFVEKLNFNECLIRINQKIIIYNIEFFSYNRVFKKYFFNHLQANYSSNNLI